MTSTVYFMNETTIPYPPQMAKLKVLYFIESGNWVAKLSWLRNAGACGRGAGANVKSSSGPNG